MSKPNDAERYYGVRHWPDGEIEIVTVFVHTDTRCAVNIGKLSFFPTEEEAITDSMAKTRAAIASLEAQLTNMRSRAKEFEAWVASRDQGDLFKQEVTANE